jgi:hypothetical protein
MGRYLRPLALVNLAVAIVFLMPAAIWTVVEGISSGSLKVTFPRTDTTAQSLAEIQSTADIENLRRRAKILTEMHAFDQKARDAESLMTRRVFEWLWILLALSGVAFLLNGTAIWWIGRRLNREPQSVL